MKIYLLNMKKIYQYVRKRFEQTKTLFKFVQTKKHEMVYPADFIIN